MNATRERSIFADFVGAFPAVAGPRFWPHVRRIVAVLFLFAVFRSIVVDCSTVPSGSMIPALLAGDRVLVNKLAYDLKFPFTTFHLLHWADPHRGDVIVFFSPADGLRLVKRVVGIPGDVVQLRDNVLYLNGVAASYTPVDPAGTQFGAAGQSGERLLVESPPAGEAAHLILQMPALPARRSFGPITVGPDHYFVMGDNRDDSFDSRYIGTIERSSIVGRALCVAFSFGPSLLPRSSRFLRSIN